MVQFFIGVTELVRLAGSTGSIGLGEEIKYQPLPLETLEGNLLTRVGRQGKIRRLVSNIQHA
jgi:hypothetical protein